MITPTQRHTHTYRIRFFRCLLLSVLLIYSLVGPATSLAGEVVLTSGERFTSSKVWQTADKVRFNMHGLVVTVDKSDVAAIIANDGTRQQLSALAPQAPVTRPPVPHNQAPPPITPPKKQPAAALSPPPSAPQPKPVQPTPGTSKTSAIGLKGIKWLMTPADINGLKLIEKDTEEDDIDQYWRPDEDMQLGQALLDGIVYGFWRNRLYSIMMWVDGQPGYKRLRKSVFSRYGQGSKSSKVMDRHLWIDRTTDRMLEFDHERNTGFFWMRSRKLDARIKALNPAK